MYTPIFILLYYNIISFNYHGIFLFYIFYSIVAKETVSFTTTQNLIKHYLLENGENNFSTHQLEKDEE